MVGGRIWVYRWWLGMLNSCLRDSLVKSKNGSDQQLTCPPFTSKLLTLFYWRIEMDKTKVLSLTEGRKAGLEQLNGLGM